MFVGLLPAAGRKEREDQGKGDGERCSKRGQDRLLRDRRKGTLLVRKKTSGVFLVFC